MEILGKNNNSSGIKAASKTQLTALRPPFSFSSVCVIVYSQLSNVQAYFVSTDPIVLAKMRSQTDLQGKNAEDR